MPDITLTVNGARRRAEAEDRTLLVEFLRRQLGLRGTHAGCDTAQCGACTVLLDGRAVKSCIILAAAADGAEVETVEGLSRDRAESRRVLQAFDAFHRRQCGFCAPGMIMAAVDMIRRHGEALDAATVRHELEGNLCRCAGYHDIVRAILAAARGRADAPSRGAAPT